MYAYQTSLPYDESHCQDMPQILASSTAESPSQASNTLVCFSEQVAQIPIPEKYTSFFHPGVAHREQVRSVRSDSTVTRDDAETIML